MCSLASVIADILLDEDRENTLVSSPIEINIRAFWTEYSGKTSSDMQTQTGHQLGFNRLTVRQQPHSATH